MKFKRLLAALSFGALTASVDALASSDTAAPVTLIINFVASESGRSEFAEIMAGVSDAMASEPGFVSAVVYHNIDNPNAYILQEVWTSKEQHSSHFDRIVASGDWAHIESLLEIEPTMGFYTTSPIVD